MDFVTSLFNSLVQFPILQSVVFLIFSEFQMWNIARDVISVFSRGGQNFDRVPREGAKYEK